MIGVRKNSWVFFAHREALRAPDRRKRTVPKRARQALKNTLGAQVTENGLETQRNFRPDEEMAISRRVVQP
jgi:hypothetical protein